jgi:peptidyl-prolyl cis-trans isomerase D
MISKMRDMAAPIMIIILVSFVIGTIFFNWGMNRGSNSRGNTSNVAGKINSQEVPLTYFDRELESARQNTERQGTDNDQLQSHQLVSQVWEQQVSRILLKDFFRKTHLYASADEVFDYIKNNPPPGVDTNSSLMTNGVFDTAKYIAVLNDPRTYEYNPGIRVLEQQTRELIIPSQKLELLLTAPLLPTKAEIEQIYKEENEKAVFEYAYIKNGAAGVNGPRITDSMVTDYYNAHRDHYKCDEMYDLYVVKFQKKATARDEQVYYQEMLETRGRLLAEKEVPRSEAFAEEAKISSDDEKSAKNGGDIGYVRRGTMAPEFDSVAFRLDSGAISLPLKTQYGYHLIYVEQKRKAGKVAEVKVRHILRKIAPTIEALDALTEKVDSLRVKMQDEGLCTVARAAAKLDAGIVFDSTGFITRNSVVPRIGYVSGLGRFLFGINDGGKGSEIISERLENSSGFYLFSLKRRTPKGFTPIETVKPRIQQLLADTLHAKALHVLAEEWSKKVGDKSPLAALKKSDSTAYGSGTTDTVTRMSYIAGIGSNTKAAAVAFALPVGKRSGLIACNGTYFIVRPLWKAPLVTVPWGSQQISMTEARMMGELRQRIYMSWYLDYKNRQKIISNLDRIYLD